MTTSILKTLATRNNSAVNGTVISIRTKGKNTTLVELSVLLDGECEKTKYTVSEGTYRKIGCPLSGDIIDGDSFDALEKDDGERRALMKALSILAYADNNERKLYTKLINHGFSRNYARFAVEECVRLGYIDEQRQLERLIVKYSGELLGPRKIMAKLVSRSYTPQQVSKMIRSLEEQEKIDFSKSKRILLETKLEEDASYEEKRKLLHKYGYIK